MLPFATGNDLALPDGLELNPVKPDFLNDIWPMPLLDSSMGSLLLVGTIYLVIILASLALVFVGRAMPRIRGGFFSTLFLVVALFAGYSAFMGIQNWNAPNSVNEFSLAKANEKTYAWLQANKVKVSQRESLDLVCDYYEAKSSFCTGVAPVGAIGGGERQIKMSKGQNGFMVLTDTKNQIPLIGEGAK